MSGPGDDDPSETPPADRESESDSNSDPEATTGPNGTENDVDADADRPQSDDDREPDAEADTEAAGTAGAVDGRSADASDPPEGADANRQSPYETAPAPEEGSEAAGRETQTLDPADAPFRWFLRTDDSTVVAIRDVLSSVAIVALIGLVLFGVSGIWPPMVAVESGSMEPNMERGDLIFITAPDRFIGDDPIGSTGVVAADDGVESGHEKFGQAGDVIVFRPEGSELRTPVIHRAHFWVEPGENWVAEKANPDYLNGATTCEQVMACPASHAGFVTKGDANDGYDQANAGARTDVVRPAWIEGKAMFRVPWLGHVRLAFDDLLATGPTVPAGTPGTVSVGTASAGDAPPTASSVSGPASTGVGQAETAAAGAAAVGSLTVVRRRLRG